LQWIPWPSALSQYPVPNPQDLQTVGQSKSHAFFKTGVLNCGWTTGYRGEFPAQAQVRIIVVPLVSWEQVPVAYPSNMQRAGHARPGSGDVVGTHN